MRRKSNLNPAEYDPSMIESFQRDINISKFVVNNVIKEVEKNVVDKEDQRNYKLKCNNKYLIINI
jgi:hypothetical protein